MTCTPTITGRSYHLRKSAGAPDYLHEKTGGADIQKNDARTYTYPRLTGAVLRVEDMDVSQSDAKISGARASHKYRDVPWPSCYGLLRS